MSFLGEQEYARKVAAFWLSRNRYNPGLKLNRHLHRHPFLSVVIEGTYVEAWEHGSTICSKGTVAFHPAGEEHSDHFDSHGALVFGIDLCEASEGYGHSLSATRIEFGGAERFLGWQIARESTHPCPIADLIVESLAFELLANCFERVCRNTRRGTPRWLVAAMQLANDCYADRLMLRQVATTVGVHPIHLARQFRRRMGCTFGEFVRRIRLTRALQQLRQTNKSIAEVAAEAGFSDQSHLTRLLSAYIGTTPAQYRRAWCK